MQSRCESQAEIRKKVKFGREGSVEACGRSHSPLGSPRARSKSGAFLATIMSATNQKKARAPKVAVLLRPLQRCEEELEGQMGVFVRAVSRVFFAALMAAFLSGCGFSHIPSIGDGGIFSSGKKTDGVSWTPIITEESMMAAARTNSDGPLEMAAANGCPIVQVEGGQRNIAVFEGNRVGNSGALVHRAEITKTARECQLAGGMVQVKYGVAGRVLLGPKGKPGTIALPVTMQVFDKTKNKVTAEPFTLNVTITRENPISYFAQVRDVTIQIKEGTVPQDYSIIIAFEKKL